ncbi:MAG: hypothetical protein U9R17_03090, partial [Thermodesulfobacteriota bacterium]|nr:hypothetical protein [Thermodesulfobacteriota bacterium]
MGRLLRQTALRFSDRTALINVERNRRFTFSQLHELTNKLCNLIKDKFDVSYSKTLEKPSHKA